MGFLEQYGLLDPAFSPYRIDCYLRNLRRRYFAMFSAVLAPLGFTTAKHSKNSGRYALRGPEGQGICGDSDEDLLEVMHENVSYGVEIRAFGVTRFFTEGFEHAQLAIGHLVKRPFPVLGPEEPSQAVSLTTLGNVVPPEQAVNRLSEREE